MWSTTSGAAKFGAFTVALVVLFGVMYGAGRAVGPIAAEPAANDHNPAPAAGGHANHGGSGSAAPAGGDEHPPGGLQVSERGYTMQPVTAAHGQFAFRITGPDGKPVTRYDVAHDKRMHLIVVRRDLSGFRHVHPELGKDGTWRVASPLGAAGSYRAYADFKPAGSDALTLGVDVDVAGAFAPKPLPAPARTATVDGFTVTIEGELQPGRTSKLTLRVTRDGKPVTDLQPYLGAYGHLVALRKGDLAYLHVHPDGEPGDGKTRPGPEITFYAEVPSAGSYRLYLDFRHGDTVRTAEFTVDAGGAGSGGHDAGGHGEGDHD
ncbi:MAG: hypothetical protein ACRDT6_00635 [Micromonosporaceae bacterium]